MNRAAAPRLRIAPPHRQLVRVATLVLAVALLGGCGDTRKMLGLDKNVPDEFKVVNRAPLSLPPDYALRPPAPGAVRPQERTIPERALAAVTGAPTAQFSSGVSTGESALLAHAGAERANPGIRDMLERENSALTEADVTFLDRLMFWRGPPEDTSPVVDAQRESQRLRENAALGKSTNDGDVPVIRK